MFKTKTQFEVRVLKVRQLAKENEIETKIIQGKNFSARENNNEIY